MTTKKTKSEAQNPPLTEQAPTKLQNSKMESCAQPATNRNDPLWKEKDEKETEMQVFMSEQSGSFSSISRTLMFGIIGTIWVLTYSDGKLAIPNNWLLISLIMSLLYFLADTGHYFWDAMSCQKVSQDVWGYKTADDVENKTNEAMKKINKRSVNFVKIKFVLLILTAIIFGVGLFLQITM